MKETGQMKVIIYSKEEVENDDEEVQSQTKV